MQLYVILEGRGGELDREPCEGDGALQIKDAICALVERCLFEEGDVIKVVRQ